MAITISGENNNDRILASDGVIDQLSGFNVVGVMTATSFTGDLTGDVTGNLTGNVTGNINNSTLLLQTGGTERLRIDSSGRVLIGTTTEGASSADTLTIAESGNSGITIRSGTSSGGHIYFSDGTSGAAEYMGLIHYDHASNYMAFWTNGNSEKLRITSAGKIGIGQVAPSSLLTIKDETGGQSLLIEGSGGNDVIVLGSVNGATNRGELILKEGTTGDAYVKFSSKASTPNFIINNNLGIGTNTPSSPLEVSSATNPVIKATSTSSTTGAGFNAQGGSSNDSQLVLSSGTTAKYTFLRDGSQSDDLRIYDNTNSLDIIRYRHGGYLHFGVNGEERLRITSSGTVNIGGDYTSTTSRLRINSTSYPETTEYLAVFKAGVANGNRFKNRYIKIRNNYTGSVHGGVPIVWESHAGSNNKSYGAVVTEGNGDIRFLNAAATSEKAIGTDLLNTISEKLRITSAGRVGIGTDNPSEVLHVLQSGTTAAEFRLENNEGYLLLRADSNVATYGAEQHIFHNRANDTEYLRIKSDGKVGIGTNNPGQKLHVEGGSIRIRGTGSNETNGQLDFGDDYRILKYTDQNTMTLQSPKSVVINIDNNNNNTDAYFQIKKDTTNPETGGTELFRVQEDGKVGIGEDNPDSLLHISADSGQAQVRLQRTGAAANGNDYGRIYFESNDNVLTGQISVARESAENNGYMLFKTASGGSLGERLRITSDGQSIFTSNKASGYIARFVQSHADNVGEIEIDSPADNNLRPAAIRLKNNGTDYWAIGQVYQSTSSKAFHICSGSPGESNSKFVITTAGKIGINESSPSSQLHVKMDGLSDNAYNFRTTYNSGNNASGYTASGITLTGTANNSSGDKHTTYINFNSRDPALNGNHGASAYIAMSNPDSQGSYGTGQLDFYIRNGAPYSFPNNPQAPSNYWMDPLFTIKSNGYVGINQSVPARELHISNASTGGIIRLTNTDTTISNGTICGMLEFEQRDSNTPGVSATIRSEMQDTTNGNCAMHFQTGTPNTIGTRLTMHGAGTITVPLSPTQFPDGVTASALVNTSGRQPNSNNDFQTDYKQNLSTGWYTIAVSNGGRSFGRMGIRETYSSRHQACMFYAGHHYGGSSVQNSIHAISSGRHSGNPLGALRIKAYGTYDGAMLQVYLRDGSNGVQAFLLGDNMQTHGWIMKNWIADGTDPGDLVNWANINAYGSVAAYADLDVIQAGGSATDGHVIPGFDNRSDLGNPSYKWRDVYCNEGAFNNSDEVLKQNILELTTAEMNAAKRISKLFRTYKWKTSVAEKGDDARIHTGAIAQQIQAAMSAEGLDATNYGFLGINEWYEDSEGTQLPLKTATRQGDPVPVDTNSELGGNIVVPEGFNKVTRYSVRYTELLSFIAAYNEQRFTSIESRLAALESS